MLRALERRYMQRVRGYPRLKRAWHAAMVAPDALAVRREYGDPQLLLAFYGGIGDELLMTVPAHELRRRAYRGVWVISEYPDVWQHNDDPDLILPWDRRHARWADLLRWNIVFPYYTRYVAGADRDVPPPRHILTMMCELAGVVGPIARKPHLTLTDEERAAGAPAAGRVLIQSGGLAARFPMRTKQWGAERFQAVVDALKHEYEFVQVGSPDDPPLDGAFDLRGRTPLRTAAALMTHALAYVGQVGMLMHLARAVDCRAVIVYGGRELPAQTGYSCNENLYAPVPCSPCWRLNTCPYAMACMREITPDVVADALRRQVDRRGQPLAVDVDVISADRVPSRRTPDGRTLLTVHDVWGKAKEVEAKFLPPEPSPLREYSAAEA